MASLPPNPDGDSGRPRWVYIVGIIALIVILLVVIVTLTGGGGDGGSHTPRRH